MPFLFRDQPRLIRFFLIAHLVNGDLAVKHAPGQERIVALLAGQVLERPGQHAIVFGIDLGLAHAGAAPLVDHAVEVAEPGVAAHDNLGAAHGQDG